jgi:hypothetical protein
MEQQNEVFRMKQSEARIQARKMRKAPDRADAPVPKDLDKAAISLDFEEMRAKLEEKDQLEAVNYNARRRISLFVLTLGGVRGSQGAAVDAFEAADGFFGRGLWRAASYSIPSA